MAYSADIDALGADHRWDFSIDASDQIGTAHGTPNAVLFSSNAICLDATNCVETNTIASRITLPTTTDINNSAQARKAVCGWYMVTAIQNPPKSLYGEGNATQAFRFILGWGNYVMFEVDNASTIVQVFGDVPLAINRPYHLCMIYENSTYNNEVRAYIDGVEQLNAEPTTRQPGASTLPARTVGEFGAPAGTVAVGGTSVILIAPINGKWNQWATWGDEADAVLTTNEVRETLFERGTLSDVTISTDTLSNMQTALDVYADTLRGDYPCCIEIEAISGGGDFELNLDNITFNTRASIHIKYNGVADTLTLVNQNGSNCSITSAPFGGSIELKTDVTLSITVKDLSDFTVIENARVFIETDTGGDLPVGTDIINILTNGSGIATSTFQYTSNQPIIGRVRKASGTDLFKTGTLSGPITNIGLTQTILLIPDE